MIKRSEFYVMMSLLFLLFGFSVAQAVSYQVSVIQPTKPVSAFAYNGAAANTWYTVCDITGKGILNRVKMVAPNADINSNEMSIKITVDGTAYTLGQANTANMTGDSGNNGTSQLSNGRTFQYNAPTYFKTSLKVEVMKTTAGANALHACADYATE